MRCSSGRCTRPREANFSCCAPCRIGRKRRYAEQAETHRAYHRQVAKMYADLGVCKQCHQRDSWLDSSRCRPCLDANNAYKKAKRASSQEAIKLGTVCSACLKSKPKGQYKLCRTCRVACRDWYRSWTMRDNVSPQRLLASAMTNGGRTLQELATDIGMSTRNVLRHLQSMEREGVVSRVLEDVEDTVRALYILKSLEVAYG